MPTQLKISTVVPLLFWPCTCLETIKEGSLIVIALLNHTVYTEETTTGEVSENV